MFRLGSCCFLHFDMNFTNRSHMKVKWRSNVAMKVYPSW